MSEKIDTELCKKCGADVNSNFCSYCGTPVELQRIDGNYLLKEVVSVLNFDKGILYTIKELVIHPGITVKKFILEDRNRIVKPVIFIIITSLIYSILRQFLQFEDGYIYHETSDPATSMAIFGWIRDNYGYGNLVMGVFIALWTKLLFKKYGYNVYEILILLCFVMGIGMLTLSLFGLAEGLTHLDLLQFGSIIFIVYATWAIGQFFERGKLTSYLKAISAYLLGMITFTLVVIITGALIDQLF